MQVQHDRDGRRSVMVAVEVPGTPELVWAAIATGPGVSSWFVPTEFLFGVDGTPVQVISHFGPGNTMDAVERIVDWAPVSSFRATSADLGPDGPELDTLWSVAACSGSTSTVRVEHSLVSDEDCWDQHLAALGAGWPWFFQVLRLSLLDFRGQPCRAFRVMGATGGDPAQAWAYFTRALGLNDVAVGRMCCAPDALPPLIGKVRSIGSGSPDHGVLLRLDEPCAGMLSTFAMPMGGTVYLMLDFYFYGVRAEHAMDRWRGVWEAWMSERYPFECGDGRGC